MNPYMQVFEAFENFMTARETNLQNITTESFLKNENFQALSSFIDENPGYSSKVMDDIILLLQKADVYKACCGGLYLGILREKGYDCGENGRLLDFFVKVCERCKQLVDSTSRCFSITYDEIVKSEFLYAEADSVFALDRENYKCFLGVMELIPSLLSFLARSRALRDKLRETDAPELCALLESFNFQFGFIKLLLNMCEEEQVYVLSIPRKAGFLVTVKELDNNFMFFWLLQKRLFESGFLETLGVTANSAESLSALFNYYTYKALNKENGYDIFTVVDGVSQMVSDTFCWGEGNISEIPRLNGKAVILIDALTFNRTWEETFIHPIHDVINPDLEIMRELSEAEVSAIIDEIHRKLDGRE